MKWYQCQYFDAQKIEKKFEQRAKKDFRGRI